MRPNPIPAVNDWANHETSDRDVIGGVRMELPRKRIAAVLAALVLMPISAARADNILVESDGVVTISGPVELTLGIGETAELTYAVRTDIEDGKPVQECNASDGSPANVSLVSVDASDAIIGDANDAGVVDFEPAGFQLDSCVDEGGSGVVVQVTGLAPGTIAVRDVVCDRGSNNLDPPPSYPNTCFSELNQGAGGGNRDRYIHHPLIQIEVVDGPQGQGAIAIDKYTKVVPDPAGGGLCEDAGKPTRLTMEYTGDGPDASSHSQDPGKVVVDGDPVDATPVRIIASDKQDATDEKAKVYFDGTVARGSTFDIDTATAGESKFSSSTFVHVLDTSGEPLQTVEFHTSCSQPLNLGDRFGSLVLVGYAAEDGSTAEVPAPGTDLGDDADTPTGPSATVGQTIIWTYVVTNAGSTPLSEVTVVDDNGTPDDTSDDFPALPVTGGDGTNTGDTDGDLLLDVGEEWLFTAQGIAAAGQYANLGTATGTPSQDGQPTGPPVSATDPSHYIGVAEPTDICEDGEKPVTLTMTYTGDGPAGSSHAQDEGKVVVEGDAASVSPVRILASDKDKPDDDKAKVWFDGTVALDGMFTIDAANAGESKFPSSTHVHIFDGDDVVESIEFHTSCSQPLRVGDRFGSVALEGYTTA